MINETKLEKLASDLQHWRTVEKAHRCQTFPSELLSRALELSKDLGVGRVAVATGIQAQKLKKGLGIFVERRPKTYAKIAPPSGERLVIELGNGKQIACTVADAAVTLAEIIRRV